MIEFQETDRRDSVCFLHVLPQIGSPKSIDNTKAIWYFCQAWLVATNQKKNQKGQNKMKYVWINPVTDSMYDEQVLNDYLYRHGYKRFRTSTDWLTVVKEKYRQVVGDSNNTVMDMRCPKIRGLLEEMDVTSNITMPDILPILIHCGQEAGEQKDLQSEEKIITTPCQALADMGNALNIENTRFVPWNRFVESIGSGPTVNIPKSSPIPPGFFKDMGIKTDSVTGEEDIRAYFKNGVPSDVHLVELLYCKEGCHNGNGIKESSR